MIGFLAHAILPLSGFATFNATNRSGVLAPKGSTAFDNGDEIGNDH